jgi:hypothetical protein
VIWEGRDDSDRISVLSSHFHADSMLWAIWALSKLLEGIDWKLVGTEKEKFCTFTVFVVGVPQPVKNSVEKPIIPRVNFFINALVS